jgi:hypothetical protein
VDADPLAGPAEGPATASAPNVEGGRAETPGGRVETPGRRRAQPPPPPPSSARDRPDRPPPGFSAGAVPPRIADDPLVTLVRAPGGGGRIPLALVGWPPIGIALALLVGELSGCGRFSASCVETFSLGSWIGQAAVIAVLLLLPAVAAIAASATVAVLAASIPVAVVLSAAGGTRRPDAAGGLLLVLLAIAWLAGAAFAIVRRSRTVRR